MKNKITTLFDVDGVIADITSDACNWFYEFSGIKIKPEEIKSLPILDAVSKFHPDPQKQEEIKIIMNERLSKEGTCTAIQPYPGAQDMMEKLMCDPFVDVRIVTAPLTRSKTWTWERINWLNKHFGIKPNKIYFCDEKYIVHGEMFLDDTPKHVIDWTNYNKEHGVLWNSFYNTEVENVNRAYSWDDILNDIEKLKEYGSINNFKINNSK